MFRPGGMSSDEDSDWDDHYSSYQKPTNTHDAKSSWAPRELSSEELLIDAVQGKDVEKVKQSLLNGADVHFSPQDRWNSILEASYCGNYDILKVLVEHGADVNCSHEKFTPLIAVCSSTKKDEDELYRCLDLLVTNGARINTNDYYRLSALSHAVRQSHESLVARLIQEGADVNMVDQDGQSPIFYAVDTGNLNMVSLLKTAGANIYVIDKKGVNLLDFALERQNPDVMRLLNGGVDIENFLVDLDFRKSHSNIYKRIEYVLPDGEDRLSGFTQDVLNVLNSVQLAHLSRILFENRMGFGHLLTSDDDRLKRYGVRFRFERQKLLTTVEKFHTHPWCFSSFGSVLSKKELDSFEIAQVISTVTRQLYLISVTTYWWVKLGGVDVDSKPHLGNIKDNLKTINNLRRKLKSLQTLSKKIHGKEDLTPSDLIVSSKSSGSSTLLCKIILSFAAIFGVCLIKQRQSLLSLTSAVKWR